MPRANINAAARRIAAVLGLTVCPDREEWKGGSSLTIRWWLRNAQGGPAKHLSMLVSISPCGQYREGAVVLEDAFGAPGEGRRFTLVPSAQMGGARARQATRVKLCEWAAEFTADRLTQPRQHVGFLNG